MQTFRHAFLLKLPVYISLNLELLMLMWTSFFTQKYLTEFWRIFEYISRKDMLVFLNGPPLSSLHPQNQEKKKKSEYACYVFCFYNQKHQPIFWYIGPSLLSIMIFFFLNGSIMIRISTIESSWVPIAVWHSSIGYWIS